MPDIDPEAYRAQLAGFCRRKDCRALGWPRRWNPGAVISPISGLPFTEAAAWNLIADILDNGHSIETIELDKPQGKTGFVLLYKLQDDAPELYIKLQFGSGCVIGRSFHYSEF